MLYEEMKTVYVLKHSDKIMFENWNKSIALLTAEKWQLSVKKITLPYHEKNHELVQCTLDEEKLDLIQFMVASYIW